MRGKTFTIIGLLAIAAGVYVSYRQFNAYNTAVGGSGLGNTTLLGLGLTGAGAAAIAFEIL
jgi:hypothetical protein